MPRTFDIRFARATGFAAILEAPANTFRWRGAASLSIDGSGVEIEPKPNLFSLLTRRARFRINTADLREVSRAGDALRIEFGMPGARRAVVPFWVKDPDVAAEIMRLVPTQRTIEMDEPLSSPPARPRGASRVLSVLVIVAVTVALFIAWRAVRTDATAPDAGAPVATAAPPAAAAITPDRAPAPAPAAVSEFRPRAAPTLTRAPPVARPMETAAPVPEADAVESNPEPAVAPPEPVAPAPSREVVAIVPGDPLYEIARRQFEGFQEHAAKSYVVYLENRAPPAELAAAWTEFVEQTLRSPEYRDARLRPMIDAELAASASWSRALNALSDATRRQDQAGIAAARADLQHASELTARAALHIERP